MGKLSHAIHGIGHAIDPVGTCLPTALAFFSPIFHDWLLPFLFPCCFPTAFVFFFLSTLFFFFLKLNKKILLLLPLSNKQIRCVAALPTGSVTVQEIIPCLHGFWLCLALPSWRCSLSCRLFHSGLLPFDLPRSPASEVQAGRCKEDAPGAREQSWKLPAWDQGRLRGQTGVQKCL